MNKMLKTMAVLTASAYLMVQAPVFAESDNDGAAGEKVEISFKVGDDVLVINGKEVQVEKPYVVGEGVTLVPLRVITEAFGATVEWDGTDKSITLAYPDVDILLQIDNPIAEVNKQAEMLLAAPELTDAGYTMVPLRFISETFGATVEWDEATQSILVIKETAKDGETSLVEGAISEAYIGDSYYKWTMENPKDMYMDQRDFDGTYTSFELDSNNWIYISVNSIPDDYDFEKDFTNTKDNLKGYTLVKADKNTSGNIKTMHFQVRDKESFMNIKYFVTSDYMIDVFGKFDNNDTETKDKYLRLMDTFVCNYTGADTYDLSNVTGGKRKFEPEDYNFSIMIPQEYYMATSEDSTNIFAFRNLAGDDSISGINISVYSKSDVGGAVEMATRDHDRNQRNMNENLAAFTDVKDNTYRTFNASEYSYTVNGSKNRDEYMRDVFFEKGSYVFNVSVSIKLPDSDAEKKTDEVLNSIEAGEQDESKLGILMRNTYDQTGTYTAKGSGYTITLPNSYKEISSGEIYADVVTSILISYIKEKDFNSSSEVLSTMRSIEKEAKSEPGNTLIEATTTKTLGKWSCAAFTIKAEDDDEVAYLQEYALYSKGYAIIFTVAYPEMAYSAANIQTVRDIIASYTEN